MALRKQKETRAPLNRERVLDAGIGLADANGIEALTMRKLARELGVEAMSLYHHVANKEELLGGMLEIILGQVDLPRLGEAWKSAIRRTATSAHEILVEHPWAATLTLSGPGPGTARFRYMDAILGSLKEGGFTGELADHAYHAIDGHIMGFTLWEIGISIGVARIPEGFLETFDTSAYPYLGEHIAWHLRPHAERGETPFEFALGLLLDGLERLQTEREG